LKGQLETFEIHSLSNGRAVVEASDEGIKWAFARPVFTGISEVVCLSELWVIGKKITNLDTHKRQ